MSYGLLLLRVVLGLTMSAHGAQKLFGWFGGPGIRGTAGMCTSLGYRSPFLMACGLALAEFGGGLSLATGLLTPLGALAVTVVMLNAVALVHWPKGFFNTNGGYELNLLIASAAIALVATGPGRLALDHAIGWDDNITGLWWGLGVLGAAIVVAFATLTAGRRRRFAVAQQPA
jgi:putative oxidoreductase